MKNKVYIVANEQQEHEVLEKLERKGLVWIMGGEKPTEWVPNRDAPAFTDFPIVLIDKSEHDFDLPFILTDNGEVSWGFMYKLEDEEIVYDGRKEEHMSEKYVVSQVFMNELKDWKKRGNTDVYFVGSYDISMLPIDVIRWWDCPEINNFEQNNRLIAIIRWVNGEDMFEVEKPKKWVIRSKGTDDGGHYGYGRLLLANNNTLFMGYSLAKATFFDTKEEAQSWANAHQEVVEVEE